MVQPKRGRDYIYGENYVRTVLNNTPRGLNEVGSAGMLSNGGRYYVDFHDHLEYATPEDASFAGTVANEFAGEQIVYHGLVRAKKRGKIGNFVLNKRVIDDDLNSWGYHASFSAPAEKIQIKEGQLGLLALHLASQFIFTGPGMIYRSRQHNGAGRFSLAQKILGLNCDFDSGTTVDKPLVNLRDEPHATEDWKRVHVTSMDPNMSPWATWLRLGTTSLVLRLIEDGQRPGDFVPYTDFYQMAQDIATDPSFKNVYDFKNGISIRAIDIQGELLQRAQVLAARVVLPAEELQVLQEWQQVYDDFRADPFLLVNKAEWPAKKLSLERFAQRHKLSLGDPAVMAKDRLWDDIGPHGVGQKLRKTKWQPWMPSRAQIHEAQFTAPTNTRAHLRGQRIKQIVKVRDVNNSTASWVVVNSKKLGRLDLHDPYKTQLD